MVKVEFTNAEVQVLSRLLDVAVKAGGMAVAGDAFILHQKLAYCFEQAQKQQEEKTEGS